MATLITRRSALSLAGATAAAALAACSGSPSASSSSASASGSPSVATSTGETPAVVPTGVPAGMGSGAADGVFPRTVTHFLGSTEIASAPTKIVIISTGQIDALLTLGIVPVGSTAAKGAQTVPDYLTSAFSSQAGALAAITSVGSRTEPSVESVANLHPDLILMNKAGKDAETLYKSLSNIAATVVTQGTGQYWKQDLLLLADPLGKTQQAQAWLDTFHADAKAAGGKVPGSPTVSLLRKDGDRLRVFGPLSFAGSVLADMGVSRPSTQSFTSGVSQEISTEKLDLADADRLFYSVQGGNATELSSMPLWSTLKAVTAGHAVQVQDDPFFLNAGPTAARVVLDQVSSSLT